MSAPKRAAGAARAKPKRSRRSGRWERGYRQHVYWVGKKRLGKVTLGEFETWDGHYVWEAPIANLRGTATTLAKAKSCVEGALKGDVYQYDLFAEGESDTIS